MKNNIVSWFASFICTAIGFIDTETVERIILLSLGIISGLVSLAFNIYNWCVKANQDKKITKEEVKELKDIVDDGIKDIEDKIKK